jgi:hypothetical protein
MDRVWLVTRGEDSDQEVICACRSETDAQTMTNRLRTIDNLRQIGQFNDPVAVPLVAGDASISEIAYLQYVVHVDRDGRELDRFIYLTLTEPTADGAHLDGGEFVGWSRRSYEVALAAARDAAKELSG